MVRKVKSVELKDNYDLYIQASLSITLVFFILVFLFVKGFEIKPYKPKAETSILVEEISHQLEEYQEPPPVQKPQLPVQVEEAQEEEEAQKAEEIEFSPTTFDELIPPPPRVEGTVYEFYAVEIKPQIIRKVEPEYPELAKRAGIEGRVVVKALVNEEGKVIDAIILQSTNPIFDEPALTAARNFLFKPGRQRDLPVKVWVVIPFRFELER